MSKKQDKIDFDFDRIFKDPKLKDDPTVKACKAIYDEGTMFRDTYTGLRMALSVGDYPKAAHFISFLTEYLAIASINIATSAEALIRIDDEKKAKTETDKKVIDRQQETLDWIEELEANDSTH